MKSPRLLGLRDLKDEFGLSYFQAYGLIQKGLLRAVRLPGHKRVWVDRLDLEKLIERSKQEAA